MPRLGFAFALAFNAAVALALGTSTMQAVVESNHPVPEAVSHDHMVKDSAFGYFALALVNGAAAMHGAASPELATTACILDASHVGFLLYAALVEGAYPPANVTGMLVAIALYAGAVLREVMRRGRQGEPSGKPHGA